MGKSVTVLDWTDIQVLVRFCTLSLSNHTVDYEKLEASRTHLLEAVLLYIQEWHPGKEIRNQLRRQLLSALDSFSTAFQNCTDLGSMLKDHSSTIMAVEIHEQASRISALLREAIRVSEPSGGKGGGNRSGPSFMSYFFMVAFTGSLVAQIP